MPQEPKGSSAHCLGNTALLESYSFCKWFSGLILFVGKIVYISVFKVSYFLLSKDSKWWLTRPVINRFHEHSSLEKYFEKSLMKNEKTVFKWGVSFLYTMTPISNKKCQKSIVILHPFISPLEGGHSGSKP